MKETKGEGEGEGGSPVLAYGADWYIRILNRGYGSCAGPANTPTHLAIVMEYATRGAL